MSFAARLRWRSARRASCFALAVVLPALSALITAHSAALQRVPFSLYFLSAVGIAALGGLGPSLLAVVMTIAISKGVSLAHHEPRMLGIVDLLRYAVLVAAAILVSLISERVRQSEEKLQVAHDALQERSGELESALVSSKCACWTIDLDSSAPAQWFGGSYPVFGRPFEAIEAMPSVLSLVHPDDHREVAGLVQKMRSSDEAVRSELRVPWPNGEVHWLEVRGNRVAGAGCRWRGVTLDITDRKLAEAALLRSEKLAAMGKLASTVAHEINNPLEAVTNLLYLAHNDDSMDEQTREYITMAERELARLSNITRLTLGFVRTSGSIVDTEVAPVLDDVLHLFQHRLEGKSVRIERRYEPGVRVHIAPHELRQIVTNLVSNAADAVPTSGGCIVVGALREQNLSGMQRSVVVVEDNGSGIDEELLPRIFEPFFSTKEEVGTGIGLWVTKELVEKNGGRILAASNRAGAATNGMHGRTQFRVEFPVVA